MVLRSGIIIPFQFRDNKKLLMIGVPEENRNLNIWDLRNVVRAAFGIYNFEFRNKKIGFNIPDELLLHYLAQRHDLTNFVIEIGQANQNELAQDNSLSHSSAAENFIAAASSNMLLNENLHISDANRPKFRLPFDSKQSMPISEEQSVYPNTSESLGKECAYQEYSICTEPRSEIQTITDDHVNLKSEQNECEREQKRRLEIGETQEQQNQLMCPRQSYEFRDGTIHLKKLNYQDNIFASCAMNRFRRRGERMSKDQKEVYVKYFEETPCMLSQRRNDSVLESHWNKLATILNNVPQGAVKNVEEWKQTFDAWRYRVFMYYRYNYKLAGSVTHNVKNFKPLTSTDQRAYSVWTSYKNTSPMQSDKADTFCKSEDISDTYNY